MPAVCNEPRTAGIIGEFSEYRELLEDEEYGQIVKLTENCEALRDTFRSCDSLFITRTLNSEKQSLKTLIERLRGVGSSYPELLPSKVAIGRSLWIAEFNLYGFLNKLCKKYDKLLRLRRKILREWEDMLFLLLVEEVYQLIIDAEDQPMAIRNTAAERLITLWEQRDSVQNTPFSDNITRLWKSRRTVVPIFGTMLGTFELMQLSSLLSDSWHDFLEQQGRHRELLQAVEEFIFGLSYSQIKTIRDFMMERNIFAVNDEDICAILAERQINDRISGEDPREMYYFYRYRRGLAKQRKLTGEPGPRRILEEMFMIYLLSAESR